MLVLWFFCYFDLQSKLCAKWKVIILDLVADVNKCNCYFVLLFMGLWINDCEWLVYLLHPAEFFRFVWNLLFFGSDIVTKYSIASLCGPPSSRLCCIFPSISPSVCICILRVFTRTNWWWAKWIFTGFNFAIFPTLEICKNLMHQHNNMCFIYSRAI